MIILKKIMVFLVLQPLTLRNYKKRIAGQAEDKWFWADRIIFKWGFSINLNGLKGFECL